jgi:hypothetical protein
MVSSNGGPSETKKEIPVCGICGLFTLLNACPMEYGVHSIGAKPINLVCAK